MHSTRLWIHRNGHLSRTPENGPTLEKCGLCRGSRIVFRIREDRLKLQQGSEKPGVKFMGRGGGQVLRRAPHRRLLGKTLVHGVPIMEGEGEKKAHVACKSTVEGQVRGSVVALGQGPSPLPCPLPSAWMFALYARWSPSGACGKGTLSGRRKGPQMRSVGHRGPTRMGPWTAWLSPSGAVRLQGHGVCVGGLQTER